jgi:hypothetical protein
VRLGLRRNGQNLAVALTRNVPNTKDGFIPTDSQEKEAPKRAGIGIMLQPMQPDGREMIITRLLEGGSAHKSGQIQAGDVITSIDGIIIAGWELNKVVGLLTGPDGSSVRLGLRRQNSSFEVPLERRLHAIPAPGEQEKLKQGVQHGSPTVLTHTPSGMPLSYKASPEGAGGGSNPNMRLTFDSVTASPSTSNLSRNSNRNGNPPAPAGNPDARHHAQRRQRWAWE